MDKCLKNDKSQDEILNLRIEAQKKYKIEATLQYLSMERSTQVRLNTNSLKKQLKEIFNEI